MYKVVIIIEHKIFFYLKVNKHYLQCPQIVCHMNNWRAQISFLLQGHIDFVKMRLFDNLVEFAKETSIHGFIQMANSSYSNAKRISWFILFCISIIYAGYQISDEVKCKFSFKIYQILIYSVCCYRLWYVGNSHLNITFFVLLCFIFSSVVRLS